MSEMLPSAASEANHRIANDLAIIAGLIRSQAAKLPQESLMPAQEVRGLLQKMSARIDAIGRLHRLLTWTNRHATVDLSTYLHEIVDAEVSSLSTTDLTEILIDLEPNCEISGQEATAVGLVVGEAITNALKYSHPAGVPGKIEVTSQRNKTHSLVIEVADDGVGLPEGFDPRTSESTGLRLMLQLAEQLSGRLEFEPRPIGLCVRLELPASRATEAKHIKMSDTASMETSHVRQ